MEVGIKFIKVLEIDFCCVIMEIIDFGVASIE